MGNKMYRTKATKHTNVSPRELANRDVSYRAAIEGIVLLENDGVLPMTSSKVALFGAGGSHTVKGGTGSGEVNERQSISIQDGLKECQINITSQPWINDFAKEFKDTQDQYRKFVRKLFIPPSIKSFMKMMETPFIYPQGREITDEDIQGSDTDTCIYVLTRQAGEGNDRKLDNGDHSITDVERANLTKCAAAYKNFIVVINVGSSFDVEFYHDIPGINALVFFAQLGSEGGRALADILTGKVSPSGKLTDTWAKRYQDIPYSEEYSYLNGDLENEYYKEGIYVGYRYFDTFNVAPRYPFGYGLSYTQFEINKTKVSLNGDHAVITATVKNTGKVSGKESVQIYVSCPQNGMHKPYQQLAGFVKTKTLGPGESETVSIPVSLSYLAAYDEKESSFILDSGDYIIRIGNSSANTQPIGILELTERILVSKHDNICPTHTEFEELAHNGLSGDKDLSSIPRVTLPNSAIKTKFYVYETNSKAAPEQVEKIVASLSRDELVELVMGTGFGSVMFGEGFFVAPGAVGQTTSNLTDRGLINATFADGPAGLRLNRSSVFTRKGKAKMLEPVVEMFDYFPNFVKRFIFAKPNKGDAVYQYATAFPVALALAQTWNNDLIVEVGKAIGTEMLEYGIVFWLGPGMNIHRNPLCGRNFEYFSEDPFLSGKIAAAITGGCQSVGGVYATLKHYAVNNQEDNRFETSANLSERALREIYLRGFEIAVRESNAGAIMTAYNKINGVYAPNSHDINTKVLRDEWGFDGVVMTDWTSTREGLADNGVCMTAGNDLLMPGGKYYRNELLRSLDEGEITDEDVRKCARNIVGAILNSALSREYAPTLSASR